MSLTDTSPKKICRWQINIWKDASHRMSSGKCKWNQCYTVHTGTLMTTIATENVEEQELSFIASENQKGYSHFGRQFGGFL